MLIITVCYNRVFNSGNIIRCMKMGMKNIRANYKELLTLIDTKSGLEGELRKRSTLSSLAIKSIWELEDTTQRITKLLDQVQRGSPQRFKSFCEALIASGQSHIVEQYLDPPDVTDAGPSANETPPAQVVKRRHTQMCQEYKSNIQWNWNALVEGITSDPALLSLLDSRNVFTAIQLQKLKDITCECNRNEQILRFLEKCSQQNFDEFCSALEENNQLHISRLLRPRSTEPSASETVLPAAGEQYVPTATNTDYTGACWFGNETASDQSVLTEPRVTTFAQCSELPELPHARLRQPDVCPGGGDDAIPETHVITNNLVETFDQLALSGDSNMMNNVPSASDPATGADLRSIDSAISGCDRSLDLSATGYESETVSSVNHFSPDVDSSSLVSNDSLLSSSSSRYLPGGDAFDDTVS